jgi:hypothetical protein
VAWLDQRDRSNSSDGVQRLLHLLLICLFTLAAGCTSPSLDQARSQVCSGRADLAEATLAKVPADGRNAVLYLMERGTVRQLRHDYADSTRDWLEAVRLEEALETHSLSKAGASLVVNDSTLAFRGYPIERTMLHTFLAKNYLAQGLWDDAAVEARNIIAQMEKRSGFPDDPYSRYMAGFCLQMIDDDTSAALQFRTAGAALKGLHIDENTGRISVSNGVQAVERAPAESELVCFIGIGHVLARGLEGPPYAELYSGGRFLGRSYMLSSMAELTAASERQMAVKRATKTVARIAVKESIAEAIASKDSAWGDLARFFLFALETPDDRRWETLPLWLGVARVPCPSDLRSFEVVFKTAGGTVLKRRTVTEPITRRARTLFSFCRDLE